VRSTQTVATTASVMTTAKPLLPEISLSMVTSLNAPYSSASKVSPTAAGSRRGQHPLMPGLLATRERAGRAVLRRGYVSTAVVLARRSAPERVRLVASTTPAAEASSVCPSGGAGGLPALAPVTAPLPGISGRCPASLCPHAWGHPSPVGAHPEGEAQA
jgi:hypothetical protein